MWWWDYQGYAMESCNPKSQGTTGIWLCSCQVYAVVEDEVELTISAALHTIATEEGVLMNITETNLL